MIINHNQVFHHDRDKIKRSPQILLVIIVSDDKHDCTIMIMIKDEWVNQTIIIHILTLHISISQDQSLLLVQKKLEYYWIIIIHFVWCTQRNDVRLNFCIIVFQWSPPDIHNSKILEDCISKSIKQDSHHYHS